MKRPPIINNIVPKLEDLPEWVTREPKVKKDVVAIKKAKRASWMMPFLMNSHQGKGSCHLGSAILCQYFKIFVLRELYIVVGSM